MKSSQKLKVISFFQLLSLPDFLSREEFTYSILLIIMVVPEPVRILWQYVSAWLWAGFLVSKNHLLINYIIEMISII